MLPTWYDLYEKACRQLRGLEDAQPIAKRLIEELACETLVKLRFANIQPDMQQSQHFEKCLERLSNSEPLQYVLGYTYFMNMKLSVNASVLIPRPETEELVLLAQSLFVNEQAIKVIDFCTGSACIALGVKKLFPNAEIWATDISMDALHTAESNAVDIFGKSHGIHFLQHDLLQTATLQDNPQFDLILSNPPYITRQEAGEMSPSVLDFEPHIALFAEGEDALIFFKALLTMAKQYLKPQGVMLCEINPLYAQQNKVMGIQAGFVSEIIKDMSAKERFWKIAKQ